MPVRLPEPERFGAFSHLVGLSVTNVEHGYSECVLEISEKLLNTVNVVQGGVVFTVADFGMAVALHTTFDKDELPATIEIKISYLAAAASGILTCESKVIQKSGKIAFLESEVRNGGRLIAKATGTFRIYKAPKAKGN